MPIEELNTAPGPLAVSRVNPRYFTIQSGEAAKQKAIYLSGAHLNNNFNGGMGPGADCPVNVEQFNYDAYLEFLKQHNHNFIRLWRWEQFKSQVGGGNVHFCATPQPWLQTGPGNASDGKPKFDLAQFDPAYFELLRARVVAAGNEGIYVSIMLFEGFGLHLTPPPDNIEGHPFHAANNINGIGITSIVDYQVLPLDTPVQTFQEAYLRKVIDTVHDLPNILYEVANESSGVKAEAVVMPDGLSIPTPIGDSTQWQYWVINFVKQYEEQQGYDPHPIGMTMQYPVADQNRVNDPLWQSPADWISPGFGQDENPMSGTGRWLVNPPANDGRKVVLSDTDHYSPFMSTALWAWKSFLRGHNPILYDFGIIDIPNPPDPSLGLPSYDSYEPARLAMGDTRRFAERVKLIEMQPHDELSSTGYALANPSEEYLVLEPGVTTEPFTVKLVTGTYTVEWYSLNNRETKNAGKVTVPESEGISFTAPAGQVGAMVLYLKRVEPGS